MTKDYDGLVRIIICISALLGMFAKASLASWDGEYRASVEALEQVEREVQWVKPPRAIHFQPVRTGPDENNDFIPDIWER